MVEEKKLKGKGHKDNQMMKSCSAYEYHVLDNKHGNSYSSDHNLIYIKTRLK